MNLAKHTFIQIILTQVTQLDMTMKEHRSEMEQRCIQLEGGFKKSQFELQQKSKQVIVPLFLYC